MVLEKARAHRRTSLEKISSHRSRAGAQELSNFRRLVTLQVHEVEYFALLRGQLCEESANVVRQLFPVYSRSGVGDVDIVAVRKCCFGELSPPPVLSVPLKCNSSRDAIHPRFN